MQHGVESRVLSSHMVGNTHYRSLYPLPSIHGPSAAPVRPARQATLAPCQLRRVRAQAIPSEIAQLAGEGGFIAGVASVMFGITLVVSSAPSLAAKDGFDG